LLAALLLAITVFTYSPLNVYLKNIKVMDITLSQNWYLLVLITVVAFVLFYLFSLLIKLVFPHIAVLYIALSVCLILEGNFLNYDLGELNGQDIDWKMYQSKIWLDTILWCAIIIASLLFSRWLNKNSAGISTILLAFLIVSSILNFIVNPMPVKKTGYYTDNQQWFEFSTGKNIVVLILDSFRADAFDTVLASYPEYKVVFKDFTQYTNTTGGYPTTYPSVPMILTGQFFDNSEPITSFIDGIENQTLPALLKQHDFEVENFNSEFFLSVYDNVSTSMPARAVITHTTREYLLAAIRYAPLLLKRVVINQYYQGNDYYHKNMVEFSDLTRELRSTDRGNVFKFAHLTGAHRPFQLDSELTFVNKGYYEQAAASLKVASDLLTAMKAEGVYDNSLVIILGDHGTPIPREVIEGNLAYIYQPLLLTKKPGQEYSEIQISSAPVSLSDIPISVATEMNIAYDYPGYSLFSGVPDDRSRRWFFYQWKNSFWKEEYIEPMFEFSVNGPAYENASYTYITKSTSSAAHENLYLDGENLVEGFLSMDALRMLQSKNFTIKEEDGQTVSWTVGPEACIYLPVQQHDRQLTLSFKAEPFLVEDQLEDQRLIITLDGETLANLRKDDAQEIKIAAHLVETASEDGQFDLCFQLPDATRSPKEYDAGSSDLRLGYKFTAIYLNQ